METITKTRIDANGAIIEGHLGDDDPNYRGSQKEFDETMKALTDKEQCQIKGYLLLKNVPGNFHISYHAKMDVINKIQRANQNTESPFNLNFKINHIGFGETSATPLNIFQ